MKILVPVDGSSCSLAAAIEVARRPWPAGSLVRVIYVSDRPRVLGKSKGARATRIHSPFQSTGCYAIENAVSQFDLGRSAPLEVEGKVLQGNPKKVILHDADEWGADLIALSSHSTSGLERFLLGSVSLAVAKHAKCSVEIVRPRSFRKEDETGGER